MLEARVAPYASSLVAVVVAVAVLVVYLWTLAPSLTFEHQGTDGGDLVAAAATLGVPHPSGYPTYTLLAWLFTRLPVGSVAYRVNLLSAFCGAATAGLLCAIVQLLLPADWMSLALSAAAGLALAFSSLFWSQAVIAEVYVPAAFLTALTLWLLVRWQKQQRDLLLWLASLTFGLALGTHLTVSFVLLPIAIWLWADRHRWARPRSLLAAMALFVVGVSTYAYLPLAARHSPSVNWGDPQTLDRFVWVVTGRAYESLIFGLSPAEIPGRLAAWARQLGDQFGWWGLPLALAGVPCMWRRDRSLAILGLVWVLLFTVYAFFYGSGDSQAYLLPALLILAIWWAYGARYVVDLLRERVAAWGVLREGNGLTVPWRSLALAGLFLLPLASAATHGPAADLSGDRSACTYVQQVLKEVGPGGLVVTRQDAPTFSLWYATYAERQRPDVAVVNGPMLAYEWYRTQIRHTYPGLVIPEPGDAVLDADGLVRELVVRNLPKYPVFATDPADSWGAWFEFEPLGTADANVYRVLPKSRWEPQG